MERDRALILTALLAGLRADELVRANVGDLRRSDDGAVIHVRDKGGKDRRIPIEPALVDVIERYLPQCIRYRDLRRVRRWPAFAMGGIPGPCSGPPYRFELRVQLPSLANVAEYTSGTASARWIAWTTTPSWSAGNGADPTNGPAASDLTMNVSMPNESTFSWASTRNPLASPWLAQ